MEVVSSKPDASVLVGFRDFASMPLPERKTYVSPWLYEGSITMISAARGTGKTWLGYSLGYALATGEPIGPWKVENTANVVLLDAESGLQDIQSRVNLIDTGSPTKSAFMVYSAAWAMDTGNPSPNLLNDKWRVAFAKNIIAEGFQVLIIDNLASLTPGIDENIKQHWDVVNQWLIRLRMHGISVVMMHHTNKSGGQRGTSAREDNIDNSILLSAAPTIDEQSGAKFIVEFTKCRSLYGCDVRSVVMALEQNEAGYLIWTYSSVKAQRKKQICIMLDEGYSQGEIASELQIDKSYVSRVRKQAIIEGTLTAKNKLTQVGFLYVREGEI